MFVKREADCFIGCGADYGACRVALFGAPFDGTASYRPGARFASARVRAESYSIETYSPYLDMDMSDAGVAVCDAGDLELPFGDAARALQIIEEASFDALNDGKIPFMIGGEHLVSLGAVRAAARAFPDVAVVQFDAHADLRDEYIGEALSHATVMRRCWEATGDGRVFQFAVRSGERSEFEFAKSHTFMGRFGFGRLGEALLSPVLSGSPVYLTIDLDALDPSELPATGTPEAGGVSFIELLDAARAVIGRCNVVGLDIVELCPPYDPGGASVSLVCKLIRELLLSICNP